MSFVNMALKNIQKKFGSYLVYLISTTFSVLIFYLFCAMYYHPAFACYRFGAGKMTTLFRGAAVAVFLFAAVFVMYAGSFFVKKQKKEIAIYALLGMRKGQIALMMFLETFFIGLLAIVCGILLGAFSSSFFTKLLMRFMAMGNVDYTFSLQPNAILVTLIAFMVLFIANGLRAYGIIYKYSLIALLSATKQSEGIPPYSPWIAMGAIFLLAVGYGISMWMPVDVSGMQLMLPVMLGGCCVLVGTFLLFRHAIPFLIANLKKRKSFYYQTANFISMSQTAFRLKANARMLSVIALLTAATITMISAAYSFYSVLAGDATKSYAPFSYLGKNLTPTQHEALLQAVSQVGEVSIVSEDQIPLLKINIQNEAYAVKDQQTGEAHPGETVAAYLLSESKYLQIISETQTPQGPYSETRTSFKGGLDATSCYFIDGNAVSDYCKNLMGQMINVSFQDQTVSFKITGAALHKYFGALDLYKCPTVVVCDKIFSQYMAQATDDAIDTFCGFEFDDDMQALHTIEAFDKIVPARFHLGGLPGNISYIGIYKANFALFGSYTFIGFFLGILFLLASDSVMYYKLIMEAQEEAPRYAILRKTGMKQGEILAAIAKQVSFVFGIPLIVGLMHTLFALLAYHRMLGIVAEQTPILKNAMLAVGIYLIVYGVFYVFAVKSYEQLVESK